MNRIAKILHIGKLLMSNQKDIQFVRYGGLSSVKQKGYDVNMPTFHSPPLRKGVYAFVWPYIEHYLLGKDTFDQRRMNWKKDPQGNKLQDNDDNENESSFPVWINEKAKKEFNELIDNDAAHEQIEQFRKENQFLAEHIRPKKFKYTGELWHHLNVPNKNAIQRKGNWVLTSFADYKKALYKEVGQLRKQKERSGFGFSSDHLEVFIEKI